MPYNNVVLIEGVRTPFLQSGTDYKDLQPHDLARFALEGLLQRTGIDKGAVDYVCLNASSATVNKARGSNIAREAALGAGIPATVLAHTVQEVSSNQAITTCLDYLKQGEYDVCVAGGVELMGAREALSYAELLDSMRLADRVSASFDVTRQNQDDFARRSHGLALEALNNGLLSDIVPVMIEGGKKKVEKDNGIRIRSEKDMASLEPAITKPHVGTVTSGNSSFLTDGASACLIMTEEKATELGLQPKAYINKFDVPYVTQDPNLLAGLAHVTGDLLRYCGLTMADIDVFEFNERFAGEFLANMIAMESDHCDQEYMDRLEKSGAAPMQKKVNAWGGSLAIGHPDGATCVRLMTHAANRMIKEDGQFAVVASGDKTVTGTGTYAMLLERKK